MQAESLYLQGKTARALPIYQRLAEMEGFTDQALYRWAQIRLEQGKTPEALKLFRRLSEEGSSPRWKRVGSEFLSLARMADR
jgi:hypothetical protein